MIVVFKIDLSVVKVVNLLEKFPYPTKAIRFEHVLFSLPL